MQQGQPVTAVGARADLDRSIANARSRLGAPGASWGDYAALADFFASRARLTGAYTDFAAAGRLLDRAFAIAPAGAGPHMARAQLNIALHRLPAAEPDIAAINRYAAPDDALLSEALQFTGDIAFYSGRYTEAREAYETAQRRVPSLSGDLRLSAWHARLGDPQIARAFLEQADSRIGGPQQLLRAYIEMRRAQLDVDAGRWIEAERRLHRADDIFPGYQPVELRLAAMRALNGAPDDAVAIYRRVADRDRAPEAFDGLASLYRARGDVPEARRWAGDARALWEARLAVLPEAALGHAAAHWLAFEDSGQGLALARRNYAARPYGDAAIVLAQALVANQEPGEALAVLQPHLAAGWRAASAHAVAAEAQALMGEARKAEAARRAALAINPRSFDRAIAVVWLDP